MDLQYSVQYNNKYIKSEYRLILGLGNNSELQFIVFEWYGMIIIIIIIDPQFEIESKGL